VTRVRLGDETTRAEQALARPGVSLDALELMGFAIESTPASRHVDAATLEAEFKYRGYLKQQDTELARARAQESRGIPRAFEYRGIPGLSREVVERLSHVRPETLGQASRVPGVTPAAVAILAARLRNG